MKNLLVSRKTYLMVLTVLLVLNLVLGLANSDWFIVFISTALLMLTVPRLLNIRGVQ